MTRIKGTIHEDQYTFLREMFRAKLVEKIEKHVLCSKTYFENRAVYDNVGK
jgi:hypothetical protein